MFEKKLSGDMVDRFRSRKVDVNVACQPARLCQWGSCGQVLISRKVQSYI